LVNGEKKQVKTPIKSFKELQNIRIRTQKIDSISYNVLTSIFKLHKITKKKKRKKQVREIPAFILNEKLGFLLQ
jgi:hypothetical protein